MSGALEGLLDPGEQLERTAHSEYPPEPRVVRDARQFVLEHAPALTEDSRETLRLLTSELVTNAVIHARTVLDVTVVVGRVHVAVAVHDLDGGHVAVPGGEAREGGWGLGLVQMLSEDSATTRHPGGGRTAWFRLLRDAQ